MNFIKGIQFRYPNNTCKLTDILFDEEFQKELPPDGIPKMEVYTGGKPATSVDEIAGNTTIFMYSVDGFTYLDGGVYKTVFLPFDAAGKLLSDKDVSISAIPLVRFKYLLKLSALMDGPHPKTPEITYFIDINNIHFKVVNDGEVTVDEGKNISQAHRQYLDFESLSVEDFLLNATVSDWLLQVLKEPAVIKDKYFK